jgi:hypothetical protein
MITLEQENIIRNTLKKHNPKLIGVFGSFARNEQHPTSDLDILVDFEVHINLLEIIGLEQELTKILGIKVDLVTLNSVSDLIKPDIERDLHRIV